MRTVAQRTLWGKPHSGYQQRVEYFNLISKAVHEKPGLSTDAATYVVDNPTDDLAGKLRVRRGSSVSSTTEEDTHGIVRQGRNL
jgi:hypothetical protein